MAKQAGDFLIEGTIDELTFYKMDGKYYVRMKSSLTGKKFWKHKAFERSRQSCNRFSEGNKLASKLYRMIGEEKRQYKLFCFLKKRAILLLKEGKSLPETEEVLMDYLMEFGMITDNKERSPGNILKGEVIDTNSPALKMGAGGNPFNKMILKRKCRLLPGKMQLLEVYATSKSASVLQRAPVSKHFLSSG